MRAVIWQGPGGTALGSGGDADRCQEEGWGAAGPGFCLPSKPGPWPAPPSPASSGREWKNPPFLDLSILLCCRTRLANSWCGFLAT